MSYPTIPNIQPTITVTPEQTVPLLLASIALEELALAHIMNAEAEKLQFILGTLDGTTVTPPETVSLADLLDMNTSVQRTLRDVIKKEMLLQFKFDNVLDLIDVLANLENFITLDPLIGIICGEPFNVTGRIVDELGFPVAGVPVTLTSNVVGVVFNPPVPVTDENGVFTASTTIAGPTVITATATINGVEITVSQEYSCTTPPGDA